METRYDELIERLRRAAQPERPAPAPMHGYLEKVRQHAYRVTDWRAIEHDWRTAPIDERLGATLGFIETMTLQPEELTPEDAERVRRAGVSDEALVDAVHVAALFNMIDRMADSLGWDVPPFEAFYARADAMLAGGYAL